jgi:hypothetical protein
MRKVTFAGKQTAVHGLPSTVRAVASMGVLLAVSLMSASGAQAQGAPGAFARVGFGARGIGAGNALVAARGSAGPYYNPAFAPTAERENLTASAALLSFDRGLQYLQFGVPLEPRAGVAFGLTHASVSEIDGRDASGYRTQTLQTDTYQVFAAFGLRLAEGVSAGLAAKFYRADYGLNDVDLVDAVGFDLGISARATERLALGLAASDLLAAFEWDTSGQYDDREGRLTTDRLPLRLRMGGAYRLLEGRARLLAEYEARLSRREERTVVATTGPDGRPREETREETITRRTDHLRLGATYRPVEVLTLRAGLDRLIGATMARPTAGFSVRQDIGRLPVSASYSAAFERGPGTTMHVFALRLFL